jgi:hypothetical protein
MLNIYGVETNFSLANVSSFSLIKRGANSGMKQPKKMADGENPQAHQRQNG